MADSVPDPAKRYQRVIEGYTTLMEGGVKPLFTLISSGNIREYHSFLGSTTLFLEEDIYSSLGGLQSFQQRMIDRTYQNEADHYQLFTMLFAAAMDNVNASCRTKES